MNYGTWVARDQSRIFQLLDEDAHPHGPMIAMTLRGYEHLAEVDDVPPDLLEAVEEPKDEHYVLNAWYEYENGESFDNYIARKLAEERQ